MIKTIYNSDQIFIFKIQLPKKIVLEKYFKIFEKINFTKSKNFKFRHKFKNLNKLEEMSEDSNLKKLLENKQLIKNLNKIYNNTNNTNKIFLKKNIFSKLLSFFIKRILLFDVTVEASMMHKNSFILPHVDSPKKIITLMLYLPTDEQKIERKLCGTYFYEVKNEKSCYFSNPDNKEVTENNLDKFYKNANLIAEIPFDSNYLYGFVRTSKSWHEVKVVDDENNRRSLNINFYDINYKLTF